MMSKSCSLRVGVILHDHPVGRHLRYVGSNGRVRVRGLNLRVTVGRVGFVVFEAVEVLVAFAARIATVGFVLFHAQGTGIRVQSFGINDRECAIVVIFEGLGVVAVLIAINRGQ